MSSGKEFENYRKQLMSQYYEENVLRIHKAANSLLATTASVEKIGDAIAFSTSKNKFYFILVAKSFQVLNDDRIARSRHEHH